MAMVDLAVIEELYRYNRWANDRMFEAVSSLTKEERPVATDFLVFHDELDTHPA